MPNLKILSVMLASVSCFTLGSSSNLAESAKGERLAMQAAETFAQGGVTLSIPKGFDYIAPQQYQNVCEAVLTTGNEMIQHVILTASITRKPSTLDKELRQYQSLSGSGEMLAQLNRFRRKNPDLSNQKVRSRAKLPIAGIKGDAQVLSYSQNKTDIYQVELCFLRDLPNGKLQICYVLSVTAVATQKSALLDVFGEITRSLKLVEFPKSADLAFSKKNNEVVSQDILTAIQIPRGFYGGVVPTEQKPIIMFGQVDFTMGRTDSIIGKVVVKTDKQVITAKKIIDGFVNAIKDNPNVEILENTAAKIDNIDGLQLAYKSSIKTADGKTGIAIVFHRVVTLPKGNNATEVYWIELTINSDADTKKARALMDQIAGGFKRLPKPAAITP